MYLRRHGNSSLASLLMLNGGQKKLCMILVLNMKMQEIGDVCEKCDSEASGPKFYPSMSIQRYKKVLDIFKTCNFPINKVVDIGCSEMSFIRYLKSLVNLNELAVVDVNRDVLEENSRRKAAPQLFDYTKRRLEPLKLLVYEGSVAQSDSRLTGYDAITCIELVEHLTENVLEMFPNTVFGFMRPKLVIVTTPNADFNVLFPNMSNRFRHWDHKFEWSRIEFVQWCERVVQKYQSYTFEIDGVGIISGPEPRYDLGFCTQIAIFRLNQSAVVKNNSDLVQSYNLLFSYEFPFRSLIQCLTDELLCQRYRLATELSADADYEDESVLIPVDCLYEEVQRCHNIRDSEQLLSDLALSAGFKFVNKGDRQFVEYHMEKSESEEEEF